MRIRTALLSGLTALLAIGLMATAAEAQTFFQKVFGFGGPPNGPQPGLRPAPQTLPAYRFHSRPRTLRPARAPTEPADDDVGPPDSGGPYRTVCVRACDGFYFPLRHNAEHRNFASDTRSCRSACGTEARLFYYSETNGSADTMIDLSGRKYADTPRAFAYRKAIGPSCTCKPEPWSAEENARHQSYAESEARELAKDEAFLKARAAAAAANATATGTAEIPATTEPETKVPEAPASGQPVVTAATEAANADAPAAVEPKRPRTAGLRRAVRNARPFIQRVRYRPAGGGTYYVVSRGAYAVPRQRR